MVMEGAVDTFGLERDLKSLYEGCHGVAMEEQVRIRVIM